MTGSRLAPLVVMWAGAVGWAVSLTAWRPVFDYRVGYLEVGTYWSRDFRVALIVLVAAALVWSGGGRRGVGRWALAGSVAWLAVDVLLDRAGATGVITGVGLAAAACLVSTGAWWLAGRGSPRPWAASRYVAACLAATLAHGDGWIPGAPRPVGWALSLLGCAVLVGCVWAAAGTRRSRPVMIAAGALVVVSAAYSCLRGSVPLGMAVLLAELAVLTSVAASACAGWAWGAGAVLVGWVLPLLLLMMAWGDWSSFLGRYNEWVVGDYLTALAGHPPVYDPNGYTASVYLACVVGLTLGGVVVGTARARPVLRARFAVAAARAR